MTSWTSEPRRRVLLEAEPILDAFTLWMLMIAAESAAVEAAIQWDMAAETHRQPWTTTSKTPPTVLRATGPRRSGDHPRLGAGVGQAAGWPPPRPASGCRRRGRSPAPTSAVNDQASMQLGQEGRQTAPAATRAASRGPTPARGPAARPRSVLEGAARSAWPGRTRVTAGPGGCPPRRAPPARPRRGAQRLDLHDPGPALPVSVADEEEHGRPDRSPGRTPGWIRPGPLDRLARARGRSALAAPRSVAMASAVTGIPPGGPPA